MIEGEGEARENHQYRGSWYVCTHTKVAVPLPQPRWRC